MCYSPSTVKFTCSCLRMQSIRLPCDHSIIVLVDLHITEFPKLLVLNRWSKHFDDDYNHIVDVLAGEHSKLRLKRGFDNAIEDNHKTKSINAIVQDPIIVRSKGCGGTIQSTSGRSKRIIKC